MGLGRFLNKRILFGHGLADNGSEEAPAILFESGKVKSIGSHDIEGDVTATGMAFNAGTVGSLGATNLRIGSSAGNNSITAAWRTIYTWNVPALPGIVGSTNAVVTQDVAASGAVIGDLVLAAPIGSVGLDLHWAAACLSAANVQLRAWYTGSTGAYTPGNIPFKIGVFKW